MRRPEVLDQSFDRFTQTIQIPEPIAQYTRESPICTVTFDDEATVHAVLPDFVSVFSASREVCAQHPDVAGVDGDDGVAGGTAVVAGGAEGAGEGEVGGGLEVEAVGAEEFVGGCWEGFYWEMMLLWGFFVGVERGLMGCCFLGYQ